MAKRTLPVLSLPVLSLNDDPQGFAEAIGRSFAESGFAMVCDHGIEPALIEQGWRLTRDLFAMPTAEKLRYHDPANAGARGYTPFGSEIAKGARAHDLKEFWHIGRDLPAGHPLVSPSMPPNIWPDKPAGFEACFTKLFHQFDRAGAAILSRIAIGLGLEEDWFVPAIADGNSVLRLLHYPPITGDPGEAIRAQAHEDINIITLLLGAEEAGLELFDQDGSWVGLSPPPGALVVNIGDMLQSLTNNRLPSTTHRVRNPADAREGVSRYSMPFFLHLRSDFPLRTLSCCIDEAHPDAFPAIITADQFLQQRLAEIGLRNAPDSPVQA